MSEVYFTVILCLFCNKANDVSSRKPIINVSGIRLLANQSTVATGLQALQAMSSFARLHIRHLSSHSNTILQPQLHHEHHISTVIAVCQLGHLYFTATRLWAVNIGSVNKQTTPLRLPHHRAMSRRLTHRTGSTSSTGSSGSCPQSPLTGKGQYRIVVMGATRVGKTAILSQFLHSHFPVSYKATVDELHRAEYDIGGMPLTLDIQDTSGSHEFPAMRELAIANADAFILVYDVTNDTSFDEVSRLREEIVDVRNDDGVPIVVVGNKIDLEEQRLLLREQTETTVCFEWENGYVECSAKDNSNVSDVFKELLVQAKIPVTLNTDVKSKRDSRRKSKGQDVAACIIC